VSSRLLFLIELLAMRVHAAGSGGISHSHNIFTVKTEKKAKTTSCGSARLCRFALFGRSSPPQKTLCAYHPFSVGFFGVSAALDEGAWLESADATRHPIRGSCSLGRSAADTIILESPKVSRRHALIHLQNIREIWLIDFGSSTGIF